jgi:hypothetical protein
MKYVLSVGQEEKMHYTKSDAENPTLYFSFLPQSAAKLKEQEKGVVFFGKNFVIGLLGTKDNKDFLAKLEAVCKGMSSKPVKVVAKDSVKFDFKIKG